MGLFIYLFIIYLWLCWIFVSVRGLSPVAASGGHSSSRCAGLSLSRPLLLWSTGSRRAGSAIVAHGPSRSAARGILPGLGSNPRPPRWQADCQPLRHQGSPTFTFLCANPVPPKEQTYKSFLCQCRAVSGWFADITPRIDTRGWPLGTLPPWFRSSGGRSTWVTSKTF